MTIDKQNAITATTERPQQIGDIRPIYYEECGDLGRQILKEFLSDEQFDTECRVVIWQLGNDFDLGNALKYLWRAGKKDTRPHTDLVKARFYLREYIESWRDYTADEKLVDDSAIDLIIQQITNFLEGEA